jgi:hypothetical protein
MRKYDLITLSHDIQKAFDNKDLEVILGYYHDDVIIISPSFPEPVCGLANLREMAARYFKGPQRTTVTLKDIKSYELSDEHTFVYCLVDGFQTVYYSRYGFKGWLSRIFVETDDGPKIISEHLSLLK